MIVFSPAPFIAANAAAARRREEARRRRLGQMGADQVLLRVTKDKDTVGKTIAKVLRQEYEEGYIGHWADNEGKWFAPTCCVIPGIMVYGLSIVFPGAGSWLVAPFWILAGSLVAAGLAFLKFRKPYWYSAQVSVEEGEGYVAVTIRRYDSQGYRNYSEETIQNLYDAVKEFGIIKAIGIESEVEDHKKK